MNRQGRRQFLRTSLTLTGLSLLSGCGVVSLPGQPASRGTKVPRIGYLAPSAAPPAELEAFGAGLRELGYTEGQNIAIEVRLAESSEQVPAMAAELVALPVDLIVSAGTLYTQAVMGVTRTIP